jgi:hypothetical protein
MAAAAACSTTTISYALVQVPIYTAEQRNEDAVRVNVHKDMRLVLHQHGSPNYDSCGYVPIEWFAVTHRGTLVVPETSETEKTTKIQIDPERNGKNGFPDMPQDLLPTVSENSILNTLFRMFNEENMPDGFRGPSLSVGHFVWIQDTPENTNAGTYWVCYPVGFLRWTHWNTNRLPERDETALAHQRI